MKIKVETREADVKITAESVLSENYECELVQATGNTLTEAVENLVLRFKQLQDAALEEMMRMGFIRVDRVAKGEAS